MLSGPFSVFVVFVFVVFVVFSFISSFRFSSIRFHSFCLVRLPSFCLFAARVCAAATVQAGVCVKRPEFTFSSFVPVLLFLLFFRFFLFVLLRFFASFFRLFFSFRLTSFVPSVWFCGFGSSRCVC